MALGSLFFVDRPSLRSTCRWKLVQKKAAGKSDSAMRRRQSVREDALALRQTEHDSNGTGTASSAWSAGARQRVGGRGYSIQPGHNRDIDPRFSD